MLFTVIHRNADGKRDSFVVESESRTALFATLKERKITPIQVLDGAVKSRTSGQPKVATKYVRWAAILIGIVGLVSIVLLCSLTKDADNGDVNRSKHPAKIAERNLSSNVKTASDTSETVENDDEREVPQSNTNAVAQEAQPQSLPEKKPNSSTLGTVYPNNKRQPPRKLFKHFSENYIAGLLRTKPGMAVVGTVLPKNFDDDFKASLSEEIKIEDEDTEDDIEIKEMMKSIKVDARKIIEQGGSIRETILEERKYLQKIAEMRHTLQQEVSKMRKAGASEEELQDTVQAANQMMDEYGGLHIKLSPFRNRNRDSGESK